MYKKIEKSSKICLCMIKKTSSHPHIQKIPKNKIAPNKVKNEKEWKKSKTTREILKLVFFDFEKNGNEKKRIKTKIKSQDYETFFCLSKHFVSHLAYKKSMPNN